MSETTSTWAVKANEAGNELATEETLHTGLTRAEAYATAKGMQQEHPVLHGKAINYYMARECPARTATIAEMNDIRADRTRF